MRSQISRSLDYLLLFFVVVAGSLVFCLPSHPHRLSSTLINEMHLPQAQAARELCMCVFMCVSVSVFMCVYVFMWECVHCAMLKFRLQKRRSRGEAATKGVVDVASRLLTIIMRLEKEERETERVRERQSSSPGAKEMHFLAISVSIWATCCCCCCHQAKDCRLLITWHI